MYDNCLILLLFERNFFFIEKMKDFVQKPCILFILLRVFVNIFVNVNSLRKQFQYMNSTHFSNLDYSLMWSSNLIKHFHLYILDCCIKTKNY